MTREEAINNLKKVLGFSPTYDKAFYTLFPNGAELSLPSDVDVAAEEYAYNVDVTGNGGEDYQDDVRIAFKAGAAWRDAQIPKLPDNIDEAAEKAADEVYTYTFQHMEDLIGLFKEGAAWMRAKLLEDAVEGYVLESSNPAMKIGEKPKHLITLLYEETNENYVVGGDKVTVQIKKKEEGK